MHRDGGGHKIENIEQARQEWRRDGKTKSTYCGKAEWEAWPEDQGELTGTYTNGTQLRRHATIKTTTRGGALKIVHNCTIAKYPGSTDSVTYYEDRVHDRIVSGEWKVPWQPSGTKLTLA